MTEQQLQVQQFIVIRFNTTEIDIENSDNEHIVDKPVSFGRIDIGIDQRKTFQQFKLWKMAIRNSFTQDKIYLHNNAGKFSPGVTQHLDFEVLKAGK